MEANNGRNSYEKIDSSCLCGAGLLRNGNWYFLKPLSIITLNMRINI